MKILKYAAISILMIFSACSTLQLKPADFGWPVESVVKVDDQGNVSVDRYSLKFNVKNLFTEETGDSKAYIGKELRIIRNSKGYYFITGNDFKNVYVFNTNDGALKLDNKIEVSDSTGIINPAFNQRPPFVSLNTGNKNINLTEDGIAKESKK